MITSEVINLNVGMIYSHDRQMSSPHFYNITHPAPFPYTNPITHNPIT